MNKLLLSQREKWLQGPELCSSPRVGGGHKGKPPSGVRAPQECREGLMHVCGSDG